ncbi:N-acetylmuramoyl-L-alanine amidase [Hyphococcus sp.]|uniref:N-acetylmuramoyl-L-alanine amidase n=1 Tax=Hyphococcus sp. TaxID=2038636 RepID=UPI002081BA91|nr:MAG: N-acetylmuramoyl-L-alanine amidase [Marinicaulis sp.]
MAGIYNIKQWLKGALTLLAACVVLLPGLASAAELLDVRFGPGADSTRIVFDINGAPEFQVSGSGEGAGRIFVDFADLDGAKAAKPGMGHVAGVSFAKSGKNGVRAELTLKKTAKIKEVFVLEPSGSVTKHRLVIDLATADKAAFLASLPSQYGDLTAVIEQVTSEPDRVAQSATSPQVANVAIPAAPSRKDDQAGLLEKKTIVVDAGHGGRDPGSQGQSGTLEKNVTLAAALELESILKRTGRYNVVLTRSSDTDARILRDQRDELARRETLARAAKADLFISLHADAITQKEVRGASVYTLSEAGTTRSMNLAKSQGNYHAYDVNFAEYDLDVRNILLDKAQDQTITKSSKFAELLIEKMSGKTPMLNRSHRQGDLRVLLAADVPAVLLEMAFISNAKDEANLISPVWRKRAMDAVADSIDSYFETEGPQRQARLTPAAGN